MIEADLKAFLDTTVGHSRVYPLIVPQGVTLPAVTYQTVSDPSELESGGVVDLVAGRFQITSIGATYLEAKTLANTIKAALNGYRAAMGASDVQAVTIEGHLEDHEEQTGRFTIAQDFIIHFKD